MNFKAFNNVFYTGDLGDTPASVNIATGDLWLNAEQWPKLKREHKVFILLHELGHFILQTRDEIEADNFAFNAYKSLGYPLSESVYALSENLTGDQSEHFERVKAAGARARAYDFEINGQKAFASFEGEEEAKEAKTDPCIAMYERETGKLQEMAESMKTQIETFKAFDECKNMKGKLRVNRCYKKRRKDVSKLMSAYAKAVKNLNSKVASRSEVKKSRSYAKCQKKYGKGQQKASQGKADMILAEQGIDSQANRRAATMDGIGGMVDSIAGIFGGGSQGQAAAGNQQLIIIAVIIALGVGAFFLMKKKK